MTARPHLSASFDELLLLTRKAWDDPKTLNSILAELTHRSTVKAGKLRRDIEKRLAIPGGSARAQSRPSHDQGHGDTALKAAMDRAAKAEKLAAEAMAGNDALRKRAEAAEATVASLKAQLAAAQHSKRVESSHPQAALFQKYGIWPGAETLVIDAVHRAYRKLWHPDTYSGRPTAERKDAERRFQEAEADFRRLRTL